MRVRVRACALNALKCVLRSVILLPPPPTHTLTHPQGKLDMLVHEEMSGGGSVDVEESLELLT